MKDKNEQHYLYGLYMDVVTTFDDIFKEAVEEGSKPIKFNEYMATYASDLEMFKPNKGQIGAQAEDFIRSALSGVEDVRITKTTPAFDNIYGADFKVQQEYNGKPASLYVDIKLNTRFDTGIRYLHRTGTIVDSVGEASVFSFSFGTVYFGVKERQRSFFKYEKPVVVMYIQSFKFELRENEMNTLAFILASINRMLIDQGYSYRVSTYVLPNYRYLNR